MQAAPTFTNQLANDLEEAARQVTGESVQHERIEPRETVHRDASGRLASSSPTIRVSWRRGTVRSTDKARGPWSDEFYPHGRPCERGQSGESASRLIPRSGKDEEAGTPHECDAPACLMPTSGLERRAEHPAQEVILHPREPEGTQDDEGHEPDEEVPEHSPEGRLPITREGLGRPVPISVTPSSVVPSPSSVPSACLKQSHTFPCQ